MTFRWKKHWNWGCSFFLTVSSNWITANTPDMVVSGVPQENGINHAGEIASMALDLVSVCHTFKIPHKPNTQLKIRAGIHSGTLDIYQFIWPLTECHVPFDCAPAFKNTYNLKVEVSPIIIMFMSSIQYCPLKVLLIIAVFSVRTCCGWCGWHQNASLLPIWGHCQHSITDGINKWR